MGAARAPQRRMGSLAGDVALILGVRALLANAAPLDWISMPSLLACGI